MIKRISTAVAAGALAALTLLAGCGDSTAPQASSAAPVPAASTTTAVATPTPTPSTEPSDETANVRAASKAFIKAFLAYDSSMSYAEYRDTLEPLMSKEGFRSFEAANFDKATQTFRSRYGKQARSKTKVLGTPKVSRLTDDSATVSVKFASRIEQRRDGKWRTVKTSPDDTADLPLVKQGERWLVDDLS